MTHLIIDNLWVSKGGKEVLRGVSLEVSGGQVHAVMGPNGSGKSTLAHALMGRPGHDITHGSITLDGKDITTASTFERAQAGLFLGLQYPIEVPGVMLADMLKASFAVSGRPAAEISEDLLASVAAQVELDTALLKRPLNVGLSGGERKRSEAVQLELLRPKLAILDEMDSGLDVDALRIISRRIEHATTDFDLAVLAITHYTRLFAELKPDRVSILMRGQVVDSGDIQLAHRLEAEGFAPWEASLSAESAETAVGIRLG